MKDIAVINACCDLGVHVNGTDLAPEIITKEIDSSKKYTVKKKEYEKQFSKDNKRKNLEGVNEFNAILYNQVKELVEKEFLPITVGGDHSIAMATALASISKYNNMGIIWFDSHADFNSFETTITGNIHGLPLAAITNYEKEDLTNFHDGNYYSYKNTVIVGGRDIDPLEKENLEKCGITVFTTKKIKEQGVQEICKKAFEIASEGTEGVHVSFDIDLIDPKIASGVSVPAAEGISAEEAYEIIEEVINNKDIVRSVDIVEFNPLKDKNKITENITKTIFYKLYNNLLKNQ